MPIGYGNVQLPAAPSLEEIANIGNAINAQNRAGQAAAQAARIPGEEGLAQQQSAMIGQELKGYVPDDVMNLLRQQGAEGSTISGISPQTAFLRALGLTSLEQQQKGVANLSTALAESPGAPLFDPTTQLLTPAQAGQLSLSAQDLSEREREAMAREDLARQELALRGRTAGVGGGGGGPRSPGTQGQPDVILQSPTIGGGGGGRGIVAPGESFLDWWNRGGYRTQQPTLGGGDIFMGDPTLASYTPGESPLAAVADYTPPDYTSVFGGLTDFAAQQVPGPFTYGPYDWTQVGNYAANEGPVAPTETVSIPDYTSIFGEG